MSDRQDAAQQEAVAMDTKYCTNCKRDIASRNFIMHEVHCRRNITLCKDCNEPVPRSELDSHFGDYHKPVKCKCGESIEISKFEEHEKTECMERLQHCEYCELELPNSQMSDHLQYCGSRTECCPQCKRYIQHRDRDQHEISNCQYPEQKAASNQGSSTGTGIFDDLEHGYDETSVHAITNRFSFPQYIDPINLLSDQRAPRSSGTLNVGGAAIPAERFYGDSTEDVGAPGEIGGRREGIGESRARRQRKNQDRVQNMYKNTNQRRPVASKKKDSTKPSNTTAANQLDADHLLALRLANEDADDFLATDPIANQGSLLADVGHQQRVSDETFRALVDPSEVHDPTGVRDSPAFDDDFDNEELAFLLNATGSSPPQQRSSSFGQSLSRQPAYSTGLDEAGFQDKTMAPCEFCNSTFPLDDLILHQSGCQMKTLDHLYESTPCTVAPSNNQRTSSQSSMPSHTPVLDNLRKPNPQRLISPDPGDVFHHIASADEGSVMLPCEFCGELLPCEFLSQHQFYCKDSMSSRPKNEVQSMKQNKKSSIRNKDNRGGPKTPPRERNSHRRQEDVTLQNLYTASDSDGTESINSPVRQSSKVKRPLPRPEVSSRATRPYSKSLSNANRNQNRLDHNSVSETSSRNRKTSKGGSEREKAGTEEDVLLFPDHSPTLDSRYRITSLPAKTTNKTQRPTRTTPKKFTNSDRINDNFASDASAFSHTHSQSSRSPVRPLNNSKKNQAERKDSFKELIPQYDSDFKASSMMADQATQPGSKKTNSGKSSNRLSGDSRAVRNMTGEGYVPSFAGVEAEPTRLRKKSNSSSVRLAPDFEASQDRDSLPLRGLEPVVSSAISSKHRTTNSRPTSKVRAKGPRKPSNPPM